jgi:hypothetical protein
MTEQVSPLATFYKPGWEHYQQALVQTIAPLSSAHLALSLGPHQRSIGELLDHLIGARFNWFHLWMGEGDLNLDWNEDEDNDEPTVYQAASLVAMFEKSWHVISCALTAGLPLIWSSFFTSSLSSGMATGSRVRRSACAYTPVDCLACHRA